MLPVLKVEVDWVAIAKNLKEIMGREYTTIYLKYVHSGRVKSPSLRALIEKMIEESKP